MKTLKEIIAEVCCDMTQAVSFTPIDGECAEYRFSYIDNNWEVDGIVKVGGTWRQSGDGYETPRETALVNGWGYLADLAVICRDSETDVLIPVHPADFDALAVALDREISAYMSTYV